MEDIMTPDKALLSLESLYPPWVAGMDQGVVDSHNLHYGISYSGKMACLYWVHSLVPHSVPCITVWLPAHEGSNPDTKNNTDSLTDHPRLGSILSDLSNHWTMHSNKIGHSFACSNRAEEYTILTISHLHVDNIGIIIPGTESIITNSLKKIALHLFCYCILMA